MIGTEKKASESEILLVWMENQGMDEDIEEEIEEVIKHCVQKQKI